MNEKLKELGLDEELAKEVAKLFKEELDGKYVTKEVFNAKNDELKKAKEDIATRDSQIKDLKKFEGDNEELKNKIEVITKENKEASDKYEEELAKIKLASDIRNQISADKEYKAHDMDLILNQLKLDDIKYDENGKLVGFQEQYDSLKSNKGFLFSKVEQPTDKNVYKGYTPADGKDGNETPVSEGISFARKMAMQTLASKGISVKE